MSLLSVGLSNDREIQQLCTKELARQAHSICLIASENIAPKAVMEACATVFTNKYAEGYSGKRFYEGCQVVDELESICIKRACSLFNMKYANVQPHSGSQANQAVLNALLKPGETLLGMELGSGGHLTHGFKANFSGKYFNSVSYSVNPDDHLIDYDQVYSLVTQHAPKVIFAGASSYSRLIDWGKMRRIAREVDAKLVADIAHTAGLIAAGALPSPAGLAHVITTTTHKTLRGPRGGLIMTNDPELAAAINKSVMPGIQGGPLMHVIAAKAVCFEQAASAEFREYAQKVLRNAKAMEKVFREARLPIISGGTDTHLMVIDVTPLNLTGKEAAYLLERHRIICNYNAIPFETKPLTQTSGIRIGTPFITSCGFEQEDCVFLAKIIVQILKRMQMSAEPIDALISKIEKTYAGIFGGQRAFV